jgi:hypothetical protein
MFLKVLVALSVILLGSALAATQVGNLQWIRRGRADPLDKITIRFALAQRNLGVLEVYHFDCFTELQPC